MLKKLLLIAFTLLPISYAQADVSISGDGFELSKDCLKLESNNIKINSEDCSDGKGKSKGDKQNSSVHGDNNPGKGNKDKKEKK